MPMPLLLAGARIAGREALADIRLVDGRVAAIGAAGSLDTVGTRRLALDGRFVAPGFWDHHVHFAQHVRQRGRVDLSRARSAAETLRIVQAELVARPRGAGDILVGYGFRDGTWPDAPTTEAIDALGAPGPVVLISGDLHCAWLDVRARERFGIQTDATGLAREGQWTAAAEHLAVAERLTLEAFGDATAAAAARGVVGIVDFEIADNVAEWPERVGAGVDHVRVEAAVWPDRLDGVIARGLRTGDALEPRGLVTMGRLKVVVDGSLNTRTALCWDRYPGLPADHPHPHGIASVPPAELRALLERARAAGIDVAVHAIGDRANAEVLDTFAGLGMRGVIEHAQLVSADDFARFAELGIAASVQPEHAMDDRDVADRHWAGRTDRAFAFASLHAAGVELLLGSDAPVAPLDPFVAIAAAISRSRGGREPWHPEQALPFDVAFAAATRGRLTVAAGEVADLVVLDADPATLSAERLREAAVAATLVGGRVTHSALG